MPFNPTLRSDFDDTPNDSRDPLEVSDWWGRPFICTDTLDDNFESWEDYAERLKQYPDMEITTKDVFEAQQIKNKKVCRASHFQSDT